MAAPKPTEGARLAWERRRKLIPSALTLNHSPAPLKIVRGEGAYLFDETGRRYTDCVNNVAHVGHSHPAVTAAISKQLTLLNTNSRYLHDSILDLAAELTATLPPALKYVIFTCTGSESNDLALRISRTVTGHKSTIFVGCAYHGHSQALIDISPYKYEGPGGSPPPPTSFKAVAPDTFRGPFKDPARAGEQYAADVERCVKGAAAVGGVAAFICESIQSCGGQIILPPGYLQSCYRHVRAAGGLCIADEVQTGFGRVGSHFWAFETQGVVPDIVTVGKPIGNGYPLSAVIMTAEVAQRFSDNGMDYFNTFGGNAVAAAAGLAVMKVIREERLQANATEVGRILIERLRALQRRHPLIGDVRGCGLFVGIELVCTDKITPAQNEASLIVARAKEAGFLLSTDGPDKNVIKMKPPMCFSAADANALCDVLAGIFPTVPQPAPPSRL